MPDDNAALEPDVPVLLIPGICGSVLNVLEKGEASGEGSRCWIVAEFPDTTFKKLWGKYDPGTRRLACLHGRKVVIPTGGYDDGGLYACDVLDPSFSFYPPASLRYYHALIAELKSRGYVPGTTLQGFAYDYRQSNLLHVPALIKKLEAISASRGGCKVDVITHSMGGLIFKLFLAKHPDEFSRLVRRWVAVASPFQGSPGFCADAFLTGVQFVSGWWNYFFIQRPTMRQMVCQAPSVFEMLPPKGHNWGSGLGEPQVTVWLERKGEQETGQPGGGRRSGPAQAEKRTWGIADSCLRPALGECLQGNTVQSDGETVSLPFVAEIMDHADEARRLMAKAVLPAGFQFLNIFGTGLDTPFSITYGQESRPLKSLDSLGNGEAEAAFTMLDGDGTVPAASASADGLQATKRAGLPGNHRQLLEMPESFKLIEAFLSLPKKLPGFEVPASTEPSGIDGDAWVLVPDSKASGSAGAMC